MNCLSILDELFVPLPEESFFADLRRVDDPRLVAWAKSYHFFSTSQAKLLACVVDAVETTDYRSLSEVTKALYEEYGSGKDDAVHSRLFARFCEAVGVSAALLPIPRKDVEPAVLDYLDAIESGYRSGDTATMLGTYCFLERSAVLSYPLMLQRFRELGFAAEDLIFFSTHVVQEAEHDEGANEMARRLMKSPQQNEKFSRQVHVMQQVWTHFWQSFNVVPAE